MSRDLYSGWEDDRVQFPTLLRGVARAREGESGERDRKIKERESRGGKELDVG